ncbi:hypothetical protein C8A05DRAFT_32984 [Staphylotrichum tortipilum]|uniref:Uncharacterized protein n=1 Tax=Staphylotrichum tortipilum TaxID=2831512 RepID=A0AAN6RV62_9PEZI|nr:hypothetical protein C8A05DRAFT_32984 [Staphylotrichum longicolle]
MADLARSISNGTCVFTRGIVTDKIYIPCGNAAFGDISCCVAGDFCLENNACFNAKYGTTYLAGCTDPAYESPTCPDKKAYSKIPWAGLIYCKPNRWVACFESKSPVTVTKGEPCTCPPATETDLVAFSAPPVIPAVALLPTITGGLIEWQAGHLPTADPIPSSTMRGSDSITATSTGSSSTAISPFPEQTSTIPPPTRGLSDSAKAGIGIGAAMGAILLLGALSAVWMVMRRRRNEQDSNNTTDVPFNPETGQSQAANNMPPHQNDKISELGLTPAPQPAEMPTPEVFSRPVTLSELPAGSWAPRPELQGDGSTLAAGSASRPPSGLIWDGQNQGWVHGIPPLSPLSPMSPTSMMPLSPLSTVAEARDHQGQSYGQGQWQGH